ncbi:MAG: hypothetical protein IKU29_03030 [Parabacteroides sp.]|nr:hypothetical protein [Parabacteroides sp.]
MVTLVVNNIEQMTLLELALLCKGISFDMEIRIDNPLKPPYLIVDGVPLDEPRAFEWIRTYRKDTKE